MPPPDAEWLRVNEINRRVLSEHYEAKRSPLQRLFGLGRRDYSNWSMEPPPPRPTTANEHGVPLMHWMEECVEEGESQLAYEYLLEWEPGLTVCDSFEKLWGLHAEFDRLIPHLDPAVGDRVSALGQRDGTRYPASAPATLKSDSLTGWVLYDRNEAAQLLSAFRAVQPAGDNDDDGVLSLGTWDSIAATMANPQHDYLMLLVAH